MHTLTIGQAAARLNLSAHTLRYYERAGLVTPVARGANVAFLCSPRNSAINGEMIRASGGIT